MSPAAADPQESAAGGRPPARRALPPGLRFAWATGTGLLGVLLFGWLTGLRGVMHAPLVALGTTALVPVSLVLGAVALVAAASVVSTLLVDETRLRRALAAGTHDSRWFHAYRGQLTRQRQSPLGWGLAAGGALGIVGIWLLLVLLVSPLEVRTLGILRVAQARLAAPALVAHSAPRAADGLLHPSAWDPTAGAGPDQPVLDAFGHPITREAPGAGAFTLRSLGLDGVASGDDLCVGGEPGGALVPAVDGLRFVEDLRADRLGWFARFAALREARCSSR